jgi:predicted nucleic acid-binding protein
VAIVVDASVGLKWVLNEPDSHLAQSLVRSEPDLVVPDFWLDEATNVLWLQVRRKLLTPDEARQGLALLKALIEPTHTADMNLHEVALDIGIEINHPTYDTLYVAFAVALGASHVVAADGAFLRSMRTYPDTKLSAMVLSLEAWAKPRGLLP